ncbi:hypothetical protein ACWIGX_28215 [Streptomyces nigrescens]
MTVKTCSDQPSTIVCPRSISRDLPLRSSWIRASRPVVSTPMSELTMKIPPMVTSSMNARNGGRPVSPPIVPGSSVRSRLIHAQPAAVLLGVVMIEQGHQ